MSKLWLRQKLSQFLFQVIAGANSDGCLEVAAKCLFTLFLVVKVSKHFENGDCLVRIFLCPKGFSCFYQPLFNDTTIESGSFCPAKLFHPLRIVHTCRKCATRDAWRCDLQGDFSHVKMVTNLELSAFQ